jgi:branched-chain amino acid transport system permease protein
MDLLTAYVLLQDGFTSGAVYVLLAVALVMVFTVTRIVFVPQGEFVVFSALTIAAYSQGTTPLLPRLVAGLSAAAICLELFSRIGSRDTSGLGRRVLTLLAFPSAACALATWGVDAKSPYVLQCIAAVALVTSMGPVLYRVAFEPLAEASPLVLLVAAIALHLVLVGLGLLVFGPEGARIPPLLALPKAANPWAPDPQLVLVGLTCTALILALYFLFGRSLVGKALRATAVNRRGAILVGVSPTFAGEVSLTFAAAIGALSGVLIGPVTTLYYDSGFLLGLKGFVGAIFGGLSGYLAAALGSVGVGVLESYSSFWASAGKEIIVFSLIVPVLLWRSLLDPHHSEEESV